MQVIIDISEEMYNSVVDHDVAIQEVDPILDSILKGMVLPIKEGNDFMVVSNGTIIAGTENELYMYWLHKLSDIMPFDEYLKELENLGTKVVDKSIDNNKEDN